MLQTGSVVFSRKMTILLPHPLPQRNNQTMSTDRNDVARAQYQYWSGPITRKEAQAVNDQFGQAINNQSDMLRKLDFILLFFAEKLGVTQEEVLAWVTAKGEQMKQAESANQNGHAAEVPAPSEAALVLAN
jgi:hypothetical protein